jgi:hypothetical protein
MKCAACNMLIGTGDSIVNHLRSVHHIQNTEAPMLMYIYSILKVVDELESKINRLKQEVQRLHK